MYELSVIAFGGMIILITLIINKNNKVKKAQKDFENSKRKLYVSVENN